MKLSNPNTMLDIKKFVSVVAAAALLITAPGLPCYQALAAAGKSRSRAAGRFNISRNARPVSAGRLAGRDQQPSLRFKGMGPVVHASPQIRSTSKVAAQARAPLTQDLITGYSRRIAGFMRDLSLGSAGVPLFSSKHKLDQITVEVFSLSPKSGGPDAPGAAQTDAVEAAPFAQGGEAIKFASVEGHSSLSASDLRPAVPHQALNTSAFGQLASGFVAGAVGLSLASLIGDAGQTAALLSPVFFSAAELLSAAAGVFGFSAYAAAAVQIGKAVALSGKRQGSGASLKEILFQPVASPNRASPAFKMIAWNWVRDVVQAHEKIHRRGYGEVGAYAGQFLGYFSGRFAKIKARLAKPKDARPAEGLVYDLHKSGFKAGYLAASVWRAGDALEIPSARGWFADPRLEFLNGMAYRIAELHQDEAKARAFLSEVEKSRSDIVAAAAQTGALKKSLLRNVEKNHNRRVQSLLEAYLKDAPHETSALRANISDADYTQGYLTGAAWRPGKQVWMPTPSFWERLNPFLRRRMQARYGRFLEGLKASLQETYGKEVRESLESKLAEGPEAAWTQEFDYKLLYSVQEILEPKHDKALDAKFPFVPGKIKIPASILGLELGHHILIMLGIYMHVAAQPYLVYGLTGNKMMMGVIRNVHFGAYSMASFLPIGPTIDRTDYPTMFGGTSLVRALIMGLIPLLYFSGHLAIGVLMAIVAFNPMFQSLMTNSDAASRDSILGRDENVVRAGAAFSTKVGAISGLAIPFAASYIVSRLVLVAKQLGMDEVAGYAMAYAGYAGMLLVAAPIFMIYVRDPRYYDASVKDKPSKNPLNIFVPLWVVAKTALKAPFYAGAWLARLAGAEPKPVLDIFDHIAASVGKTFSGIDLHLTGTEQAVEKLAGDSGAYLLAARYALKNAAHNAASFVRKIAAIQYGRIFKERAAGLRSAALSLVRSARSLHIGGEGSAGVMASLRGWSGRILQSLQRGRASLAAWADKSEATQGVAVLLRSDALMILMAVNAVQLFLADALMFVVVPNYIIDVIRPQADMNLVSLVSSVLSPAAAQNGLVRPLLDFVNPMLQTKVGIQGLMFTAGAVGTYLGSRWADGQKGAQRIKFWGHTSLYKASAIGNLFFWAMVIPTYFVSPAAAGAQLPTSAPAFFAALGIFLGMQFVQHLLSTPLSIAMAPVRRKQIPNDMVGKVSAAFTMVDVGLMAIGALSVGVLIDVVSIRTAVTLIAAGVTLTSVMEWMAPQWLRRINPEGWHDGEKIKSAPSKESAKPVRTAFLPVAEPALVFAV